MLLTRFELRVQEFVPSLHWARSLGGVGAGVKLGWPGAEGAGRLGRAQAK